MHSVMVVSRCWVRAGPPPCLRLALACLTGAPNPLILCCLLPVQMRAMDKKAAKPFERIKNEKCGSKVWTEVGELAELIR
jgi:hypothetical protein